MTEPARTVKTDRGDAGRRLDLVLRRHLQDVDEATRTRIQRWIESGRVAVNGAPVRRVAARAALGDVLTIALPPMAPRRRVAAEDTALDVLYEDSALVVVNKPAGVVVHPTYGHAEGTIMNALLWRARSWPEGQRPSLVGRLDKMTSGLLVAAKSRAVHAALQRAMTSDRSQKDYLALVYGKVKARRGSINLGLSRDPRDRRRVVVSSPGAASLTHFERLAVADAPRAGLSLVRCRLMTGRMHQIRVHLAAHGWPIVGDQKYGEPRWQAVAEPVLAAALKDFPRQALHAWRLALPHPVTRQPLTIEAPLPPDLRAVLDIANFSRSIYDHSVLE